MTDKIPNILVVDDMADWRTTFHGLLQDEGYYVEVAESSQQALALLVGNVFTLAVLDPRLDEASKEDATGIDLAKTIGEQWPEIVTIIVTGYETDDTFMESIKPRPKGDKFVYKYLLKMDAADLLVPTIKEALATISVSQ